MDEEELRRMFQILDRNGDGRLTKNELNDSLKNVGIFIPDAELAHIIEKSDVNGEGYVGFDEFGALYKTIFTNEETNKENDMREAFNVFDQNKDGFITVDELESVLGSLGLKQGGTSEDCRKIINKVDVDGDGRVNFMEFKQMMMSNGGFVAFS